MVTGTSPALATTLRTIAEMPHVLNARLQGDAIVFGFAAGDAERASLLAELVRRGTQPVDFAARESNLEDVFLSVTKGTLQ